MMVGKVLDRRARVLDMYRLGIVKAHLLRERRWPGLERNHERCETGGAHTYCRRRRRRHHGPEIVGDLGDLGDKN